MNKLHKKIFCFFICFTIVFTIYTPITYSVYGKSTSVSQILNISLLEDPISLDVSLATTSASKQIQNEIYEGLTRQLQKSNGSFNIEAAGATKWTVSKNGCVWTFHLRDNYWSDGVKVTPTHYVDSILRTLDPKTNSPYAYILYPIKNSKPYNLGTLKDKSKVGLKVLAGNKLEITLENPCPYFLELTHMNIMKPQRLDFIKKYGSKYALSEPTTISCGPFEVNKWTSKNLLSLDKNPKYWDKPKVNLNIINFKISENTYENFNESYFENIEIAECKNSTLINKLNNLNKYNSIDMDDTSTTYTFFNETDMYFKNSKIRKAFILADNRQKIIDDFFGGMGEPAYALCPPSINLGKTSYRDQANLEPVKKLINEYDDAKALLIEGLKEIGKNSNPTEMDITFLQCGNSPGDTEFAELIKKSYDSILGINMKIKYVKWDDYDTYLSKSDYQISSLEWCADYNDPINFFELFKSNSDIVNTGFKSKTYDSLLLKASKSTSLTERLQCFKNAEDLLIYKEAVISPTTYKKSKFFYDKKIKNLYFNKLYKFELKYASLKNN